MTLGTCQVRHRRIARWVPASDLYQSPLSRHPRVNDKLAVANRMALPTPMPRTLRKLSFRPVEGLVNVAHPSQVKANFAPAD